MKPYVIVCIIFVLLLMGCKPASTSVLPTEAVQEEVQPSPILPSVTPKPTDIPVATDTSEPSPTPLPPTSTIQLPTPTPEPFRPLQILALVYSTWPFDPAILGENWEYLTTDNNGDEGTCLLYSKDNPDTKENDSLLVCANTMTSGYDLTVTEETTRGWTELQSGLEFSGLGKVNLRADTNSDDKGSFLAWLPVGEDFFSVQINLAKASNLTPQDYYDQELTEVFQLAFNRLILDAGIPIDGVLFVDDFSTPAGWLVGEGDWGKVGYEQNGYSIALNGADMVFATSPNLAFVSDVSLSVEAKAVEGGEGVFYGIVCRYQDLQNFYMLRVTSGGYYSIAKYVDDQFEYFGGENWFYDEKAILRGDQVNTIRGDCIGDTLSLYVNDQLLMQVTDGDLTLGNYGIVAGSLPDVERSKVWFDNFSAVAP